MYETDPQSNRDQFWLNVGIVILIAGLFVAGLYYYQQKQLTQVKEEVEKLESQLASFTETADFSAATNTEINQKEAIIAGSRELPRIALTFDADMTSSMDKEKQWFDPQIIEILKEKQVPATFFLTGLWAETYPEVTLQLADNNLFEIESHSYQTRAFSQPCYGLTTLEGKQEKKEAVTEAQQALKEITGSTPRYFRFPGGCYEEQDLALVNNLGLKTVQWDVVSGDAFAESSTNIVNRTTSETRNGSIIVLHLGGPNAPYTAPALEKIIPQLKEKGFQFSTVETLLNPPRVPSE